MTPNAWADMVAKMATYIGEELTSEEIDSLQDDLVRRFMANGKIVGSNIDRLQETKEKV